MSTNLAWNIRPSFHAGAPSCKNVIPRMSTTTTFTAWRASPTYRGYRLGRENGAADAGVPWSVEWVLRRADSLAARQLLWLCAALCLLSLGIGAAFWQRGAGSALPLAAFELLAAAAALAVLARHAGDRECIALRDDGLTVEHVSGRRVERVAFGPGWVRVEPRHGDRSLIELSGQGRRIAVGRYVRPELRVQLADELRWALRRWQQRAGQAAPRTASTTTE
jgi:uncharacterized membrane protein